jgi:hypothetical protein
VRRLRGWSLSPGLCRAIPSSVSCPEDGKVRGRYESWAGAEGQPVMAAILLDGWATRRNLRRADAVETRTGHQRRRRMCWSVSGVVLCCIRVEHGLWRCEQPEDSGVEQAGWVAVWWRDLPLGGHEQYRRYVGHPGEERVGPQVGLSCLGSTAFGVSYTRVLERLGAGAVGPGRVRESLGDQSRRPPASRAGAGEST